MNIIIADDDPISRRLLSALLIKDGNGVVTCADGGEAMEKLATTNFDIAILDWMMPQISGIDVCRKLRQSGKTLYIVLLTARSSKTDLLEGLNAGADDYIVKPCDEQELRVRLRISKRIIDLQHQVVSLRQTLDSVVSSLSKNSSSVVVSDQMESTLKSLMTKFKPESNTDELAAVQQGEEIQPKQRRNWKYEALQAVTAVDASQKSASEDDSSRLADTL